MTSTIDLSQPDFTYCDIKNTHKHSEYLKMIKAYEAEKNLMYKSVTISNNKMKRNASQDIFPTAKHTKL